MYCLKCKLASIVIGWWYFFYKNKAIEKMATDRLRYCDICYKRKGNLCTECNCYIPAKVRSKKETCKLNYW